ncbi:MAG TPA: sialidase family protein [Candidatus Binataceae bacterium]|nr:sialidase family protein [Candidatus Binataceae bacterium]
MSYWHRLARFLIAGSALGIVLAAINWSSPAESNPKRNFDLPAASIGTNIDLGPVPDYQGNPSIAVNPNNSQELVAATASYFRDPNCPGPGPADSPWIQSTVAVFGSTDGGNTWTYNCAPLPPSLIDIGDYQSWWGTYPTVAWDADGNAYVTYQFPTFQPLPGLLIAKSTDAGTTWSPWGSETLAPGLYSTSKIATTIDTSSGGAHSFTNRIYTICDQCPTLVVGHSDDGSAWTQVSLDDSGFGGSISVSADGTVNAVWNRLGAPPYPPTGEATVFSRSTDGGNTWTAPTTVAQHILSVASINRLIPAEDLFGVNSFGSIAINRASGTGDFGYLYVAYTDFSSASSPSTDTDVFVVRSIDGGSSWSQPVRVNDDSGSASQFLPSIAVDPSTGIIAMSWYDTRNDPGNKRADTYFSFSVDAGQTWSANQQVTSPSPAFFNQVSFSDENSADNSKAASRGELYGKYTQMAALGGAVHPIWIDSRMFYPEDSGAGYAEDPATARISLPPRPVTPTITPTATTTPTATMTPTPTLTATPLPTPAPGAKKLKLSASSLAFGKFSFGGGIGQTSAPKTLTITNQSAAAAVAFAAISTSSHDFAIQSDTCQAPLAPHAKCSVMLTFTPSQVGSENDRLTLIHNALGSPQSIGLSGTGVAPKLKIKPTSLSLASVVEDCSPDKQFTLTNSDKFAGVAIESVDLPDSEFSEFYIDDDECSGSVLESGQSCIVLVTFCPSESGLQRDTIEVIDDAAGSPQHVKLTGSGFGVR